MKALSIRQPWVWAILHSSKRIENRAREDGAMPEPCRHRGPLLIHASKGMTRDEYVDAADFMLDNLLDRHDAEVTYLQRPREEFLRPGGMPSPKAIARGAIVGRARAIGVIRPRRRGEHEMTIDLEAGKSLPEPFEARWWIGGWALVLADVEALPTPIPCSGSLGLWTPKADIIAQLPEAWR